MSRSAIGLYCLRPMAFSIRDSRIWTAIDHRSDFGNGAKGRIGLQIVPIAVKSDQPRFTIWHRFVETLLHGQRERLEHLALFNDGYPLEGVDIVGVNREKPDEFIHSVVEVAVEFSERRKMLANARLLFGGLLEQALGHDEFYVVAGNENLLEAILHAPDAVGHEN